MIRSAFPVLAAASLAGPALGWTYGSFDNGSWFEAHVSAPNGAVRLSCGGASPGGLPLPETDEPNLTGDYALMLTLDVAGLGGPGGAVSPVRTDIMVASGTRGFVLPNAAYDELNETGWLQPIRLWDPLVDELRTTRAIAVDAAGERLTVIAADGLVDALDRAIAFCDVRWATLGRAMPAQAARLVTEVRARSLDTAPTEASAPPPATGVPDFATRNAAKAAIRDGCGGAADATPAAYMDGDIDGDGVTDIVLNWNEVTCSQGPPRPFCGASMCSAEVFLSATPLAPGDRNLLAGAVALIPLSNGNTGLKIAGNFGTCREQGRADCEFIWYWDGSGLVQLP